MRAVHRRQQPVEPGGAGLEALDLATRLRPDVLLVDIRMPGLDGVEVTRRLAGPDVADPMAVLVITTFDLDEYVLGALRAGELFIGISTVKTHVASLLTKLDARNRVEIAMWAYDTKRV